MNATTLPDNATINEDGTLASTPLNAFQPPAPPQLAANLSGTNLVVSWISPAPGFVLQQVNQLTGGTNNWLDTVDMPWLAGESNIVTLPFASGLANQFYPDPTALNAARMRRPAIPYTLATAALGCLAVWRGIILSGSAQSLPNLNAQAISNRTFSVSWPYTNSGFALQESTDLTTAAWQPSALAPDFNSNTTTFTVSAVTTHAARFFRLKQPADLRGIYIDSNALPISSNNAAALVASFSVPGVDGLVLVMSWNNLETNFNRYNWTNLDYWMSNAMAANLKVDLSLRAGDETPMWLFHSPANGGAGATPLTFSFSPSDGQSNNCQTAVIAAPWDTNFLAAWDGMLTAVSNHLSSNGAYGVREAPPPDGIESQLGRMHLPAQTADSTGLDCVSERSPHLAGGWLHALQLVVGLSNLLASGSNPFPGQIVQCRHHRPDQRDAFPPIDDNGVITNIAPADQNRPLLALASQMFRGRLVIQNNSLYPDRPAMTQTIQSAQSLGTLIAFQTNENGPGASADCDGTCYDTNYPTMLQTGIYPLGSTNSLRAQYIEIFAADALAFTNAILQAHQELFAPL